MAETYKVRLAARDLRNSKLSTENAALKGEVAQLKEALQKAQSVQKQAESRARLAERDINCYKKELIENRIVADESRLLEAAAAGNTTPFRVLLRSAELGGLSGGDGAAGRVLGKALCHSVHGSGEGHRGVAAIILAMEDCQADVEATLGDGEDGECECGDEDDCFCGERPLHIASASGSIDAVKELLRKNPDLEARGNLGTALHVACKYGNHEVANELAKAGASTEALDDDGEAPQMASLPATLRAHGVLRRLERLVQDEQWQAALDLAESGMIQELAAVQTCSSPLPASFGRDVQGLRAEAALKSMPPRNTVAFDASGAAMEAGAETRGVLETRAASAFALCEYTEAVSAAEMLVNVLEKEGRTEEVLSWRHKVSEWKRLRDATHYELLCVEEKSELSSIKKGYYKLSKQWHPDKHMGNEDSQRRAKLMFQKVSDAYEVLSDPLKKEEYDMQMHIRWAADLRRRRSCCDKEWFASAMHDPHVNIHDHSETFDDKEFDEYLCFMRKQMGM